MSIIEQPLAYSLGWTLLHFIWQGLALAGLYAAAMALLRGASANARYLVGLLVLVAMAAAPVVTLLVLHGGQEPAAMFASASGAGGIVDYMTGWMPWLVVAWLAGVAVSGVRLGAGWLRVRRLARRGISAVPDWVDATVARLAQVMRVPVPVYTVMSSLVVVPTVIGWLRPIILLPAGAVTGLSPRQLEMVLAHELAHVRRFDYLVNLLQALLETLLYYHPAVRWVSARVRVEREHCCDDVALDLLDDRAAYARALAAIEVQRSTGSGVLALAVTGGGVVGRIRRLCGGSDAQHGRAHLLWIVVLGAIVAAGLVLALTHPWAEPDAPDPEPETIVAEADEPADIAVPVPTDTWRTLLDEPQPDALAPSPDGLLDDMQRAADRLANARTTTPVTVAPSGRLAELPQPVAKPEPVLEPEPEPEPVDKPAMPAAISTPKPEYPVGAARRGIQGTVHARYAVAADGRVSEVEIVESGGGSFDRAVVNAVSGWRFEPPANGKTVLATETFNFSWPSAYDCTVTGSRLCHQRRQREAQVLRKNILVIGRD